MTDPEMSRDEAMAIEHVQDELGVIDVHTKPTRSGRFRVMITTYNTGVDTPATTKTETRELIELLIGTARALEGL